MNLFPVRAASAMVHQSCNQIQPSNYNFETSSLFQGKKCFGEGDVPPLLPLPPCFCCKKETEFNVGDV